MSQSRIGTLSNSGCRQEDLSSLDVHEVHLAVQVSLHEQRGGLDVPNYAVRESAIAMTNL